MALLRSEIYKGFLEKAKPTAVTIAAEKMKMARNNKKVATKSINMPLSKRQCP